MSWDKIFSVFRLVIFGNLLGVCMGATKSYNLCSQNDIRLSYSAEMRSYMDNSTKPCEDFYQYACGSWHKHYPFEKPEYEISVSTKIQSRLTDLWEEILKDPVNEPNLGNALKKAKDFFASCTNTIEIEKRDIRPLIEYLEKFGGWPAINSSWAEEGKDWLQLHAALNRMGKQKLISWYGRDTTLNFTGEWLYLVYPPMFLGHRRYYKEGSKQLVAYKTFLHESLKAFNVAEDKIEAEFKDILDFELKLSNIVLDVEENEKNIKGYQLTTLGELETNFTSTDWLRCLQLFTENLSYNSSLQVVIHGDYLVKLDALLKNTTKRTIFNYLGWHISNELMSYMGDRFTKIKQKLLKALDKEVLKMPRLEECIKQTQHFFEVALASVYAERNFNKTAKEDATIFVSRVKESFRQYIEKATWIDKESKTKLTLKLENLRIEIGYPDLILNSTEVDELYAHVNIKKNDYLANGAELATNPINDPWTIPVTSISYMYLNDQEVFIPAAIFQPPYYHKDLPNFINYAGIGAISGRSMSHDFDTENINYDHKGEKNNSLSNAFLTTYKEKEQCFLDKYEKYTFNDAKLKRNNLWDYAVSYDLGLKVAFLAYNTWLEENKNSTEVDNEQLVGFKMSKERMFFLSFAQNYCTHIRQSFKTSTTNENVNGINDILSNFENFSVAYNCPIGSRMNPEERCDIW